MTHVAVIAVFTRKGCFLRLIIGNFAHLYSELRKFTPSQRQSSLSQHRAMQTQKFPLSTA